MSDNKIFIRNIWFMLSYVFDSIKHTDLELKDEEDYDNADDLFAKIISNAVARQIKRGLYREYINKTDDLSVIKGKLNIAGTIRNKLQKKLKVSCTFEELSVNDQYNSIIKTACFALLKNNKIDIATKNSIKKSMLFFADVDIVDPKLIRWGDLHFHRNNASYETIISICKFLLENNLPSSENGRNKLINIDTDEKLYSLYEKFIRAFYRHHYNKSLAVESGHKKIQWDGRLNDKELPASWPAMYADVVIEDKRSRKKLILDAKYYTKATRQYYGKERYINANLYQIFTYVENEKKAYNGEVMGMLLYAQPEGVEFEQSKVCINENWYYVKTLNLNQKSQNIANDLVAIINDCFGDIKPSIPVIENEPTPEKSSEVREDTDKKV